MAYKVKKKVILTSEEKIRKAVKIIKAPFGTQSSKHIFLTQKLPEGQRLTEAEYLEALNIASGGELLKSALDD